MSRVDVWAEAAYASGVFGRKEKPAAEPVAPPEPKPEPGQKKNRPTMSRKEAEAARKRPLVIDDRKAAREADRKRRMTARAQEQNALMTGDEEFMPQQHRGPVKRFVRDIVDARWNVGEFSLILVMIPVIVQLAMGGSSSRASVFMWSNVSMWIIATVVFVDTFWLSRIVKRRVTEKFGVEALKLKPISYGVMRALQLRRLRLPKPQVNRGQKPE